MVVKKVLKNILGDKWSNNTPYYHIDLSPEDIEQFKKSKMLHIHQDDEKKLGVAIHLKKKPKDLRIKNYDDNYNWK